MPWSDALVERLARPDPGLLYRFESLQLSEGPDTRELGDFSFGHERIAIESSSIADAAGRLVTMPPSVSLGTWSVALRFDPAELAALSSANIIRGGQCCLKAGWEGLAAEDYEIVRLGVVHNLRFDGQYYIVDIEGIETHTDSRQSLDAGGEALFHDLGAFTAITTPYVAGDATVHVVSTTGFVFSDSVSLYTFRIEADDGTTFYLSATGITANSFTGCTGVGQFGTIQANASSGKLVYTVAHDERHPSEMMRTILVSTGTPGTNGQHDDLPAPWGFAVLEEFIDEEDCDAFQVEFTPTGDPEWILLMEAPQPDGRGWFNGYFNPGGWFVCERQGRLTIRCLANPWQRGGSTQVLGEWDSPGAMDITHADIVSVDSYDRWDPSYPEEAETLAITCGDGEVEVVTDFPIGADTRPGIEEFDGGVVAGIRTNNRTNVAREVLHRLTAWACRVPEVVEITCRGFRTATLAIGDFVRLTAPIVGRSCDATHPTLELQRCLVASCRPDWFGCSTRLTLLILPENYTELDG